MALNNADVETEALLSEGKDPVSGNDVPLGAKPEEVRDDIDARVSENEYVIPAYAVRYFGPQFFDELLASAQQGWERIKAGEEEMPDTDMPETAPRDMEFAEGGAVPKPVGGGYGGYGGTGVGFGGFESKTFVNDSTGQQIIIYYYNGKPMSRIPEGFREKGETPVEEQAAEQTATEDDGGEAFTDEEQTWRNTPVKEWTPQMYNDYGDYYKGKMDKGVSLYKLSGVERAAVGFVGSLIGGPLGGLAAVKLVEKANVLKANEVARSINNIMETGSLPSGEKLTQNVVDSLTANKFIADSIRAEADPYGQTEGVSITDQPFYRTPTGELDIGALMPPGTTTTPSAPITTTGAASTGAASSKDEVEYLDLIYTSPSKAPPARPESITVPSSKPPSVSITPPASPYNPSDDNDDGGWDDFGYDPGAYEGIPTDEQLWNKGGLVQRPNKK